MIKISKTGILILVLSFCLYLVSMQSVSGLLFLLLGILFGCLVINIFRARKVVTSLKLTPPKSLSAVEGELFNSSWTVENTSNFNIGHIEVLSKWGTVLVIRGLGPREVRHLTPQLKFSLRGIYRFSELRFYSSYPFGLIKYRKRVHCSGEIVVYPMVYSCSPPVASGFVPMLGGRFSGKYRSRTGDLFHGVKPFQPQDPVKLIHWRSSSKGLGLMVKEFDEELSGRVSVILATSSGKKVGNESFFDWAARAAGSLVLSALDAGYQVEFVNLSDLKLLSISPFVDGDVVLDALARIDPSGGCISLHGLSKAISNVSAKSGLSLILTGITSDLKNFLNKVSSNGIRKISIYLPSHTKSEMRNTASGAAIFYYSSNGIFR